MVEEVAACDTTQFFEPCVHALQQLRAAARLNGAHRRLRHRAIAAGLRGDDGARAIAKGDDRQDVLLGQPVN